MPTVTWDRLDPIRRAAVVEAAETEFGEHGFSQGSLNAIARRGGVAKGSLFQYFTDKRDLYAYIVDVASERVRSEIEGRIHELNPSRPFFEFLTDLRANVAKGVRKKWTLKQVYEATRAAMDPKYGHWPIYDHCMPFDVSRCYDEVRGIEVPRVWTAKRDREMWRELEG